MKRKTFDIADNLSHDFEVFTRQRMLVEKRVIEAMMLYFMDCDAETREKILLDYSTWAESDDNVSSNPEPQLPKKYRMAGKSVGRNPRIEIDGKVINEGTNKKGKK